MIFVLLRCVIEEVIISFLEFKLKVFELLILLPHKGVLDYTLVVLLLIFLAGRLTLNVQVMTSQFRSGTSKHTLPRTSRSVRVLLRYGG